MIDANKARSLSLKTASFALCLFLAGCQPSEWSCKYEIWQGGKLIDEVERVKEYHFCSRSYSDDSAYRKLVSKKCVKFCP